MRGLGIPRILRAELFLRRPRDRARLNGAGLAIVNPPWTLDDTLRAMLPALHAALPSTGGGWKVDWLVPEA